MTHQPDVDFDVRGAFLVAGLSGDFGGADCAYVFDRIAEKLKDARPMLIVDFARVSRAGGLAIGKLLRLNQTCRKTPCRLAVMSGDRKLRRALRLAGVPVVADYYSAMAQVLSA
jgi:anti-anti-sigma regulatory factor